MGLHREVKDLDCARARAHRQLRSLLASAARAGRSERDLAAELGKSQPEIHRLLTASTARAADGSRRTWMTARDAVAHAKAELRAGHELEAFKMIVQALNHLGTLDHPDDIAEWAVTPTPIPHPGLDTLLQALTRRAFQTTRTQPPGWADPRPLTSEWVLAALPAFAQRVKKATPPWLAELNVYVSERDLITL